MQWKVGRGWELRSPHPRGPETFALSPLLPAPATFLGGTSRGGTVTDLRWGSVAGGHEGCPSLGDLLLVFSCLPGKRLLELRTWGSGG